MRNITHSFVQSVEYFAIPFGGPGNWFVQVVCCVGCQAKTIGVIILHISTNKCSE